MFGFLDSALQVPGSVQLADVRTDRDEGLAIVGRRVGEQLGLTQRGHGDRALPITSVGKCVSGSRTLSGSRSRSQRLISGFRLPSRTR